MEYDPTNRGVLFKRHENLGTDKPNYTGSLNTEGKDYFFEGRFIKSAGNGKDIIALEVTQKSTIDRRPSKMDVEVNAAKFFHEHGRHICKDDLKPNEYAYTIDGDDVVILFGSELVIENK